MTHHDDADATTIDVHGIPIACEIRGEGTPILLIHGWSADRQYMLADLEPIFDEHPGWRRIYFDLPGHGATPAPGWLSTQDQMLSIMRDFIEAVLPEGPFAIAGSSYGGHIALGLIRSMPERLCGAGLLIPDVPAPDGTRDTAEAVVLFENPSIFEDLAPDEEWIRDDLVVHERRMVDEILAHDMPAYRRADYAFLERLNANYLPTGAASRPGSPLDRPSLILTGRQDSTVGYRAAWGLMDEFPRATYAVLDMAGHQLGRIERPEAFRALVGDWLERMAPRSVPSSSEIVGWKR
jgi:pimeloyl-ACP methyl ester carboxylesterase